MQRPFQRAGALRGEIERHAEAEEAVERADDAQIDRAGRDHRRIAVEQPEPGLRKQRRRDADRLGQAKAEPAADPGRAQRAVAVARADVGADQRDQRPAEAEGERDQQIFQPRADAVAGDRGGAEGADHAGGQRDGDVGHDRGQRGEQADPQDVAEQRPAQPRLQQLRRHHGAAGPEVVDEGERAERRSRPAARSRRRPRPAPATGRSRRSARRTAGPAAPRRRASPPPGTKVLPVPRMMLASVLNSQIRMTPANTMLE